VLRVTAFQGRWFLVEAFKDYIINYETGDLRIGDLPIGAKVFDPHGHGGKATPTRLKTRFFCLLVPNWEITPMITGSARLV
jgi:hypothetical protein